ncbi:MAG: glycyl-radical enzyme activating protein [Negativicutes bacterium]|nr:glycyl-radical enzyme activating protein [Negativicutes bacterium]
MTKATIFNIQKFCVHDGPGIRTTVFFKGCPLACSWCHNPESQAFGPQLLVNRAKCSSCGQCARDCPHGVDGATGYDTIRCVACGRCVDACPQDARVVAGREYSLAELMVEIEKDQPFYEQSGGGVTLSGGEALCQIDFVAALVSTCRQKGIGAVIDTCGQVPYDSIARVLDDTELFLYDLKFADPDRHRQHTGQDNALIIANLERLCRSGAAVHLRVPLIAGLNDDDANIEGIVAVAKPLSIAAVNLLPYHDIGRDKYKRLGREYPDQAMATPSAGRLEEIRQRFAQNGFKVTIGG